MNLTKRYYQNLVDIAEEATGFKGAARNLFNVAIKKGDSPKDAFLYAVYFCNLRKSIGDKPITLSLNSKD